MTICEAFLEREKETLSPYACLTSSTKGRDFAYTPCEIRTEFQRDRDRIIHSQSFRRLMHKTQVFLAPKGDHYRTRLTHTLEVTQIARILARALHLNEDLTEAATLGHDLGHTPFGHAGEEAIQKVYSKDFSHYKQSLRVVEHLENGGQGLNLTWEVRDAIVNHTGSHIAATLEGVLVKYADRIAYINHDIDDACRAGLLCTEQIPKELREILGETHSGRINTLVSSVIEESMDKPEIKMAPNVEAAMMQLRRFLFDNVYFNETSSREAARAQEMLAGLFEYFEKYPEKMPALYRKNIDTEGVRRCVCDYISGMTDRYAIETYKDLFIPKVWSI